MASRHFFRRDAQEACCGLCVDVGAESEGFGETALAAAQMGENAQFDLGIVGGQQEPPRRCDERLANSSALLGANRDVL